MKERTIHHRAYDDARLAPFSKGVSAKPTGVCNVSGGRLPLLRFYRRILPAGEATCFPSAPHGFCDSASLRAEWRIF